MACRRASVREARQHARSRRRPRRDATLPAMATSLTSRCCRPHAAAAAMAAADTISAAVRTRPPARE